MGNVLNLPSDECYSVMQDSKGYIWIATENGLCRYNGNSLKVYNKENGLPEASVYDVSEDKAGDLWLLTSMQRILKIKDGILQEQRISRKFTDVFRPGLFLAYRLSDDDQKNYIVTTEAATYKIDRNTSSVTNLSVKNPYKSEANFIIVMQSGRDYIVRNKAFGGVAAKKDYNISIELITKSGRKEIKIPMTKSDVPDWRIKLVNINGIRFFNINNRLIRVDRDFNYKIYTVPGNVLSLQGDKQNGLWIGFFQKGFYYFDDIDKMSEPKKGLTEYSVTGTMMDTEGGVWCTTLEKGMFYCNNKDLTDYSDNPELKNKATLLKSIGHDIYASSGYERYFILRNDSIIRQELNLKNSEFTDIIKYKDKFYLGNRGYLVQLDSHYKLQRDITDHRNFSLSTAQITSYKDKIYASSPTFLFEIKDGFEVKGLNPKNKLKIRCLLPFNDDILFIGSTSGLYKFDLQKKGDFVKIPGIDVVVTKIIRTTDNKAIAATRGQGLMCYENGQLRQFKSDKSLNTALVSDVAEDQYGNIWAGCNDGLIKIQKSDGKVYRYTTSNGLLSNNVNKIAINGNAIFVSTTEGLCSFPLTASMANITAPKIYLNSMFVNNRPAAYKNGGVHFPHYKNAITLSFDVLAFKNENKAKLLYKFRNQAETFRTSAENKLTFDNLKPDNYELVVYALNSDGVKSLKPVILSFEIEKPFWLTYWFLAICLMAVAAISLFIIQRRTRIIREREENKTRISKLISESQLSALQAQMNPHFIFNAINSIQSYILKNDESQAYDYLSKFSSLIRMVLNNSRESILSLDREIQTLSLYIELEQLRFKNSFEFIFAIDEDINVHDVQIPSMLIQPYVENAIWHGLMNLNRERSGILRIRIEKEFGMLKIVIEDNGIGREVAGQLKKDDLHKPVAMGITDKRLSIIRKMHDYEKIRVEIGDITDSSGETCGTKVTLYLPLTTSDAI